MHTYKISLAATFFSLLLWSSTLAALAVPGTAQAVSTATQKPQAVLLADVNISDAKILSQENNIFHISFDLSNGVGAQNEVMYGVELVSQAGNSQFVADQKVYPEVLSLAENSDTKKEITYTAPQALGGKFDLVVQSTNKNGLPLGIVKVGTVILAPMTGVQILPSTCFLQVVGEDTHYLLQQGVDIGTGENLSLTCTAKNNENAALTTQPSFETRYRTAYGDIVPQISPTEASVTFAPNEQKTFSLTLPKAADPQAYDVAFTLQTGSSTSNAVAIHYVVRGESATLQNVSLDKNYYKKGETANLTFVWTPSADGFQGARVSSHSQSATAFTVSIADAAGNACVAPVTQALSVGVVKLTVPLPVLRDCANPHLSLLLTDAAGVTLAQKELAFKSPASAFPSNRAAFAFAGILLLLIIAYFLWHAKKQALAKMLPLLFFAVVLSSMVSIHQAQASTFYFPFSSINGINVVVNLNNGTTYKVGDIVPVTTSVTSSLCANGDSATEVRVSGVTAFNNTGATVDGPATIFDQTPPIRSWESQDYVTVAGTYYFSHSTPYIGSYGMGIVAEVDPGGPSNASANAIMSYNVISPLTGLACTSRTNACGQTNSGTYDSNGNCTAVTPSNSSCPVAPPPTPPTPPSSVGGSCNATGTAGSMSWGSSVGATAYALRYAPANGSCSPGWTLNGAYNECDINNYAGGQPVGFSTTPGQTYTIWAHGVNASGWSTATVNTVSCTAPVKTGIAEGYLVGANNTPFNPGVSITANGVTYSGVNPYYTKQMPVGNQVITSSQPAGYTVSYLLNTDGGGDGAWHNGTSVTAIIPANGAADLWWKYTPAPSVPSGSLDASGCTTSSPSSTCTLSGNWNSTNVNTTDVNLYKNDGTWYMGSPIQNINYVSTAGSGSGIFGFSVPAGTYKVQLSGQNDSCTNGWCQLDIKTVTVGSALSCPAGYTAQMVDGTNQCVAVPSPSCTVGASCTSAANSCGMTNSGTLNASCVCSATTPPDNLCSGGGSGDSDSDRLPPTVSLTTSASHIHKGSSVKLTWTSAHVASCSLVGTNGFSSTNMSGTNVNSGVINSPTTFTLTCSSGGSNISASQTVTLFTIKEI